MAIAHEGKAGGRGAGAAAGREAPGDRRLKREVGLVGLLFASLGSIIGSGWLFGALFASQIAGPAALISWGIGGVAVILLALIHAELGGAYPVAGGSARFPHYAFGSIVGFAIGWIAWLGAVTTAPIEVEAALQYATNYASWLTKTSGGQQVLTPAGYGIAAILMGLFAFVNLLGVRWLAETNKIAVWWKIFIPVLTIAVLLIDTRHGSNFTSHAFAPAGLKGVLSAVSTGGVIFAYLGFEQAIQLGGETTNPRRNIPISVVGAMLIGIVIYMMLQLAFLLAIDPSNLSHGWSNVAFQGRGSLFGPFAGLATALGLGWLAVLLYTDAVISPGGTGLLYTGTSSRISFALARNGYVPNWFGRLSLRGVPVWSILVSWIVGMIVFLPFPGWQQLVGFITSATVLAYAIVPLAFSALRRQDPDRDRPFRLPFGDVIAPLSFVIANLIIYWTGWTVDWKLFLAVAIGFVLFGLSYTTGAAEHRPRLDWRPAVWLWPYLGGMALISYLGAFDGRNKLTFPYVDTIVVAVFSLVVFYAALHVRLGSEEARASIEDLSHEADEEERELNVAG